MANNLNRAALKVLKELVVCTRGDTATGIANALKINRDAAYMVLERLRRDGFVKLGEGTGVFVSTLKGKETAGEAGRYW